MTSPLERAIDNTVKRHGVPCNLMLQGDTSYDVHVANRSYTERQTQMGTQIEQSQDRWLFSASEFWRLGIPRAPQFGDQFSINGTGAYTVSVAQPRIACGVVAGWDVTVTGS